MLRVLVSLTLLLGAALFVACGGDDDDDAVTASPTGAAGTSTGTREATRTPAQTDETDVSVTLTDDSLTPDPDTVPAGRINFNISNTGEHPHTLIVILTDLPPDGLTTSAQGQFDPAGSAGGETILAQTSGIGSGANDVLSYELEAGSYVLISNAVIDGVADYANGMYAAFTVE